MSFATNLKYAMDERRMTQNELATLSGMAKSSISQYLSGKQVPKTAVLQKLADALETSVDFLTSEGKHPIETSGHSTKNVPVEQAAQMLGKSKQFVRVALQRGIAPFGFAVKVSGNKWFYYISPRKLNEYLGVG